MRVTIIGGSKGTGARLAEASLTAGHDVTVLSRSGGGPSGVTTVLGDATEPGPVREAVAGADAVGVTVGGAKRVQEATIMSWGLDWTIARPAGLTDKPGTGSWQVLEVGDPGTLRGSIPRADLAAVLLRLLDDRSTVGKAYGVSSRVAARLCSAALGRSQRPGP